MEKILEFLSGKKGVIASIILTITGYFAANGTLGENEVILIGGLTTIIFGSASYATKFIYNKNK